MFTLLRWEHVLRVFHVGSLEHAVPDRKEAPSLSDPKASSGTPGFHPGGPGGLCGVPEAFPVFWRQKVVSRITGLCTQAIC